MCFLMLDAYSLAIFNVLRVQALLGWIRLVMIKFDSPQMIVIAFDNFFVHGS